MRNSLLVIYWTLCTTFCAAIKVPSSWKDEQTFLPYYVVVDGLPSAQNHEAYYPPSISDNVRDQVVQNDIVVKLFEKMNPHLQVLPPQIAQYPAKSVGLTTTPIPNIQEENTGEYEEESQARQGDIVKVEKNREINHENPGDIPTKPIYPGEGLWARKNLKHRPHITKNVFEHPPDKSDGSGSEYYATQKRKFQKQFDEYHKKPEKSKIQKDEDYEESKSSDDFEPYKTYAQVRRTVSKKRVPKKKVGDPRLTESIKDSKIHTVYTEEGYEDNAYDHGEQEKRAESNETLNGADKKDDFDFPNEPDPPSEDDENSDEIEEENEERKTGEVKKDDEKESESKFDSKKTLPKTLPVYNNEEELIDSVMDESKHGKKLTTERRKRRSIDSNKYPNYDSKRIDSLSSLRYIENPDDIPTKSKAAMSFYDKADKIECPEVIEINPVLDKIKNSGNNTTISPKLDKLGDQIDCLKARYFGEDPLDNPLFKEDSIETPSRFFKDDKENELDYEVGNPRLGKILDDRKEEVLPEAEPYTVVKRIYRRPPHRYFTRNKIYSMKKENRHPPPVRYDGFNSERISEVHYKDEIKPSEQMNVLADIINNIKNSSRDPNVDGSHVQPVSIKIDVIRKHPQRNGYRTKSSTNPPRLNGDFRDEIEGLHNFKYRSPTTDSHFLYGPTTENQIVTDIPKRYRKRRRKPRTTTTQRIPFEISTESANRVKKRRIKLEYQNNSANMNGFKPIVKEEIIQMNHKPEYEEIETSTTNKYYFVGMRPPPQRPFSHPNLYSNNHQIKRRKISHPVSPVRKRVARSAKRGYAEIQRGRARERPETTTIQADVEEEDDYTPHRSRNFHYDEKSGKIVYDKKPEETREEEIEYEYVEIEEPTHPPPPSKKKEPRRIWPSKFPDGPNYLDFIKKLKEDTSYVQILDPSSTEKPTTTTTMKSPEENTGIPEFLAILGKVRGDKDYKFIEDPKVKIQVAKIVENVDEEVIEEDIQNSQNSPGAQGMAVENMGLSSSESDSGIKSRNYVPKTNIDTSKYKSIQRAQTTRHSISSRYSSDDDDPKDQQETSMDEVETKLIERGIKAISTTTTESFTIDIPTTSIPSTIPFKIIEEPSRTTTVKTKRVLLSNRRRGTTTIPSTTESMEKSISQRQRQRGRGRFRATTTTEEPTRSRRNLQRRHQANLTVPKNHKPHYDDPPNIQIARNTKATPRNFTLDLIKQMEISNGTNGNALKNKSEDVEVFKDYDKNEKHGGNYKYKKVQIKITRNYNPYSKETEDGGDVNYPKPFPYYADTKLPMKINQLKEKGVDIDDASIFEEENREEEKSRSNKQNDPVFIRDPSKRFYYYAPV